MTIYSDTHMLLLCLLVRLFWCISSKYVYFAHVISISYGKLVYLFTHTATVDTKIPNYRNTHSNQNMYIVTIL